MSWRKPLPLAALTVLALTGCARPLADRVLAPSLGAWRRIGQLDRYDCDNLFNVINGEAEHVFAYGFRSLTQAVYRRSDGVETTVDLYDLGSAANAFGLFRSRASVAGRPVSVGSEGSADEARVEFWQGRFYVALSLASPADRDAVVALARTLAEELPPTRAWPAYLGLLPSEGRVPRSEQYLPADFFGYSFLQRAVSARYRVGEREVTAFVCRYDGAEQAADALASFRAELEREGTTRPLTVPSEGFGAEDPVLGSLTVFRRGRFLGGVTAGSEAPGVAALLAALHACLRVP